jgi:gamma-glutamyltranspeptidase
MVATAHPLATRAGLEMLRAGGSAVDAAIAAQLVLNVVEPHHSGIGGGGFLLFFDAKTKTLLTYDGRETAPASARPGMFLGADGQPREFLDAVVGGLSVGVPGLVRMLAVAHHDYGRIPWAKLFQPAIEVADNGFPVSPQLHRVIAQDPYLRSSPEASKAFLTSAGEPWPAGARMTNKALAATFRRIADGGPDAFYKGAIARDISRAVGNAFRNPAALTPADIAGYRAIKRDAVCLPFRVWRVCGMGPPSSGGITTLQILGVVAPLDLGEPESVDGVHRIVEASRLAFADRDRFIADPAFVAVPTVALLDPGYLAQRRALISEEALPGPVQPGLQADGAGPVTPESTRDEAGHSTTHLSIVDADGNAVALTSSIEYWFGSRLMVRGFMLNNELTDFAFAPTRDGTPVANRVEAGKRPRSSMSPTLVFDEHGKLVMSVGSPGGSLIIGYVAKTLLGVLGWGLDIQQAIDLPNFLNRDGPTELEAGTPIVALKEPLEQRGQTVVVRELKSGLQGIVVTPTGLQGGADPRGEGQALGD